MGSTIQVFSIQKIVATLLISFLVVCSVFANSAYGLDYTLAPRFSATSLALAFVVIYLLLANRKLTFPSKLWIPLGLYLAYYLISLLSILYATNKAEAIFDSQRTGLGLVVFVCFVLCIGNKFIEEITVLKILLLAGLVVSAVAIYQLIGLAEINADSLYTVKSYSGHKNLLSGLLLLFLIPTKLFFFRGERFWKLLCALLLVLVISLLFLLKTKSVWLGIIFSGGLVGLVYVLGKKNRKLNYLLVVTAALSLLVIALVSVSSNQATKEIKNKIGIEKLLNNETANERLLLWSKTLTLIKHNKWMGVGAGNWPICYPSVSVVGLWRVERMNVTFQRPHNDFLWVLSETGMVGFLLYYGFVLWILLFLGQTYFGNKQSGALPLIYLFIIISYLVFSFFDFPKERIEHTVLLSIIFSMLFVNFEWPKLTKQNTYLSIRVMKIILILFIFSLTLNIIIGYYRIRGEHFSGQANNCRLKGDAKGIIENCDQASSYFYTVDPTTMPIKWYRGIADFSSRNYNQALVDFYSAYKVHPYNQHVLNNLGSTFEVLNHHQEAKLFYQKALDVNVSFDEPKLNLAAICFNEGDYERAMEWTKTTVEESERKSYYLKIIKEKLNEKYHVK